METSTEARKHTADTLMDLSKGLDSLPIKILVAKFAAYGVSINSIELLQSYLTNRKKICEGQWILNFMEATKPRGL